MPPSAPGENNLTVPTLSKPDFTFTVPESARQYPTDPTSFKIEAWSVAQRLDAERAAGAGAGRLDFELFQRACVQIDGKAVDQAHDLMAGFSPKVMSLVTTAIDHIGIPSTDETAAFLASVVKRV